MSARDPFARRDADDQAAPPVIGPDYLANDAEFEREKPAADGREPTVAFLPSEPKHQDDAEVTLELRRTNDDQLAVLAYSSLESLVAGCGERQPWVALPMDSVDTVATESGAGLVLWDAGLPEDERRDATNGGDD